ncbi:MAG: hypothetical protein M3065_20130 [Actinomycetota bacterium]|nr:hypothetical protein [Actinomycetota bacterium]
MTIAATALDPDGRIVQLTEERWEHIISPTTGGGHPELAPHQAAVIQAVQTPDRRIPGRRPNEEWFYLAGAGPSRWLKVVVAYEAATGRIITAFGRRALP